MSSEIYELMKRPDEVEVVEKAHRDPRFVEDCVREMVRMAVEPSSARSATTRSSRPPGEPRDDPPATTSWPSATGCSASSRASSARTSTSAHHVTMREWLEAAGENA